MTSAARDTVRPLGEAELMARLVAAAHDTIERRLSQAEVDSILEVAPRRPETSARQT